HQSGQPHFELLPAACLSSLQILAVDAITVTGQADYKANVGKNCLRACLQNTVVKNNQELFF
ncbi:MAG: hypothetical protein CFE23_14340, partial [Flavobacterium sp. BFFFF1]|uniref:hypothetical protein n=1 Tax=Flavobacterium sp. BFFFF1 TaxID=2015557 RepID=UPI000BD2462C